MISNILLTSLLMNMSVTMAQPVSQIARIGKHYPIFTIEKNENPENIMIAYTKLDSNCHIEKDLTVAGNPIFDFYWLMNRKNFKPVHPLIKSGIRDRLKVSPVIDSKRFMAQMNELKEVRSDIKDPRLLVVSQETSSGVCDVQAFITLGPSDHNITLRLDTIYSESEKTFLPPFRKVKSVTLNGVNKATGQKISRRYLAK